MPDRLRPLLIAEAANPEWVSVPLIGWSLASALRAVTDAHIVTQIRNRDAFLRAGLVEGRDFTAIDSEAVAAPMWKAAKRLGFAKGKGWTMLQAINALTYPYFEYKVWQAFRDRIADREFDLVHRITPLSPTTSSLLAARCKANGIPFIMGPLNGGVPWPAGFDSERRREREWLSYVRGAYKALPGRRSTLASASAILVGSRHTQSEIPAAYQSKCIYLPENAIDPQRFNLTADQGAVAPIRACFVGRMVPYKGPDMALEAAAPLLRSGRMTLQYVGDGPMNAAVKQLAEQSGVSQAVTFHGQLPHTDVQAVMAGCNLLTFPSIREFGGGVVLEAMALGVVPVVVDYAGPGELVDETTGYKIPIGSRAEIVSRLGERLEQIATAPGGLAALASAAQNRVRQEYTWPAKAAQIRSVYDWVLGKRATRPEFGDA